MDTQPFNHEARQILATALAALEPREHRQIREAAAQKLISDFLDVARDVGFEKGRSTNDQSPYISSGESSVRLGTDGGGNIRLYRAMQFGGHTPDSHYRKAELTFDYVAGEFVGSAIDASVAPRPGERLPREHAFVVLARVAAELFALPAA